MINTKSLWLSLITTLLVASIIWAQPLSGGPRVPTVLMIIVGVCVLAKGLFSFRDERIRRFILIIALFFIPTLLSLIGSYDYVGTLKQLVILPLFIMFAAAFFYFMDNKFNSKLFYSILLIVCCFWIFDGAVQLLSGQDLFGFPPWPGDGIRIVGPFGERLRLGLFLSITLPLVLFRLKSAGVIWQLLYLACAVFMIMLTGVRTDLLTALIATIIYLIANKKAVLLFAFIPVLFIVGMWASNHSTISDAKLKTFSTIPNSYEKWNVASSYRLDIWQAAGNMLLNNPVNGVGAKGFKEAYDDYADEGNYFSNHTPYHAHHPLISIAAETGLVGLSGLLTILFLLVKWGRQTFGKSLLRNPWFQMLILIFFPIQSMPLLFTLWWFPVVAMAMLFYLNDINNREKENKPAVVY